MPERSGIMHGKVRGSNNAPIPDAESDNVD